MSEDSLRPAPAQLGVISSSMLGAAAGVGAMILILLAVIAIGAMNAAPFNSHRPDGTAFAVAILIQGMVFVGAAGSVIALPTGLVFAWLMRFGERLAPDAFAALLPWLAGGAVAASPLIWLAYELNERQRLDEPGPPHVVLACALIAGGTAWWFRHGRIPREAAA